MLKSSFGAKSTSQNKINWFLVHTSTMENFLDLNRMLKSTSNLRFSHLLIVGDFNFKEINWSLCESLENEGHMSSIFLEGIRDCFLFQHIREPTIFRESQKPSILDLIFTNEENMVDKINHLPSLGKSDHVVLCFNFTCFSEKPISTVLTRVTTSHV